MLTRNDIEIVKSTAPVVAEHAVAITRAFYTRMFRDNPEVRRYFNMAHQRSESQPRALAGAICAYAANIDNPAALVEAVDLIAHKHCSLEVRPEQYPIVGSNLLAAIREVLGGAATDEILGSWERAYGVLAEIFISREEEIYRDQAGREGGWTGRREFVVDRRQAESENITSFYLVPRDGGSLPDFLPGQYLTVYADDRIRDSETPVSPRNYSISSRPGLPYFRISVKREPSPADSPGAPGGIVSNLLHDGVKVGDVLQIGPPYGTFHLGADRRRPIVLLSGGVGLTPMVSMLQTLAHERAEIPIWFLHAARNSRVHALREEIAGLAASHAGIRTVTFYSEPLPDDVAAGRCDRTGLIDLENLRSVLPGNDADFYFCGPPPFMGRLHADLREWGVPETRLHFEFFGPRGEIEELAFATA